MMAHMIEPIREEAQTARPIRGGDSLPEDLWDIWVVFEQRGSLNAALSRVFLPWWCPLVCLCSVNNKFQRFITTSDGKFSAEV